jgi:hypothetical protein
VANRIYRDIWSTREALQELQHDGVLATIGETDPIYCYAPQADLTRQIKLLAQSYNEPIERDTIQNMMRSIAKDASFRRARRQICGAYELQMI